MQIKNGLSWLTLLWIPAASGRDYALNEVPPVKSVREIFEQNCVMCHGEKGDGNGPAAKAIIEGPKPRNFIKGDYRYGSRPEELLKTITNGVDGTAMPSWKTLPLEEREALVQYVLSLKQK